MNEDETEAQTALAKNFGGPDVTGPWIRAGVGTRGVLDDSWTKSRVGSLARWMGARVSLLESWCFGDGRRCRSFFFVRFSLGSQSGASLSFGRACGAGLLQGVDLFEVWTAKSRGFEVEGVVVTVMTTSIGFFGVISGCFLLLVNVEWEFSNWVCSNKPTLYQGRSNHLPIYVRQPKQVIISFLFLVTSVCHVIWF